MPGSTGGISGGGFVFRQAYQNIQWSNFDTASVMPWDDGSVASLKQTPQYPPPMKGQQIEIEGIACLVILADEGFIYVSPLGSTQYFQFSRRMITGRWKEREVVHA